MLTKSDFDGLFANPFDIPDGNDVLSKMITMGGIYKHIAENKAFSVDTGTDKGKVIRYIIFVYTQNTPLEQEDNYLKRKVLAAKLADFDMNSEMTGFTKAYEDIIQNKNKSANTMILNYCFMQHNPSYTLLMQSMDNYWKELSYFNGEEDASKRSAIIKNYTIIADTIEQLKIKLLNNDNNTALSADLFVMIENEDLPRPEVVADRLSKGEDPVDVYPYGKKYKPEKLKYIPE